MERAYTPAYFRKIATYYQGLSESARDFGIPKLVCNRLLEAATQFRYAAQAIEDAKRAK